MIRAIPAETSHADLIKPKKLHGDVVAQREDIRAAIHNCPAITFVSPDEQIIAIVGFHEIYEGSGEIWALISDEVSKHPIAFGRKAKILLERFAKQHKMRRLQMVVRRGFKDAFDFAIFLGFQPEGTLRKYGPEGDDYYMMGKVY